MWDWCPTPWPASLDWGSPPGSSTSPRSQRSGRAVGIRTSSCLEASAVGSLPWARRHGASARRRNSRDGGGGCLARHRDGNSTGTVIAALPRLDPGPLWLQGDASLADLSVSAGGSLPFQPDGAFVITGTRSIDTSALGSLLGGGGLPFTYSSLGPTRVVEGRAVFAPVLRLRVPGLHRLPVVSLERRTVQYLAVAGGGWLRGVPAGWADQWTPVRAGGQYRANLVQTGGEGIQIQETRNELTDVEVSGQISGTTGWGIARGDYTSSVRSRNWSRPSSRAIVRRSSAGGVTAMGGRVRPGIVPRGVGVVGGGTGGCLRGRVPPSAAGGSISLPGGWLESQVVIRTQRHQARR